MSLGKIAVDAIKAWDPFSPEAYQRRDRNKAYRKARRKKKRGEELTPEEQAIMAGEVVKVELPDGTVVERVEPTIKARTSTKLGGASLVTIGLGALSLIPFYDQANALIMQACSAENGPLVFLGGMAVMAVQSVIVARKVKSPVVPGAL